MIILIVSASPNLYKAAFTFSSDKSRSGWSKFIINIAFASVFPYTNYELECSV